MLGRSRSNPAPPRPLPEPWTGAAVAAVAERIEGRRGRTRPGVRIGPREGDRGILVWASDLAEVLAGRQGVAESDGEPFGFVSLPSSGAPTSVAAEQMAGMAADDVAVLRPEVVDRPVAVVAHAERDALGRWVREVVDAG